MKMEENDSALNRNSRPSSYYDNLKENEKPVIPDDDDYSRAIEMKNMAELDLNGEDKNPTQEILLNTTVPQNMANVKIAGKHTPTRNSLRHSRMIVMNRNGQAPPRIYQPHIVRCYRLATTLAALQTLFGAAICCLAAWLLLWAPNLRRRDNPYWSGLPLLASGTFALLLMCCCKKGRRGTLRGYLVNGIKVCSIMLSLVSAAAAFTASVFAMIHLITLSAMDCVSNVYLDESCVCKVSVNSTYPVKSYHYADLKCPQVDQILTFLLIFSAVVNFLAGVACLWYVYLHCASKNEYSYSKVRTKTNENNNGVIAT